MNCKRKGTRAEHRAIRLLEADGYRCTRSAASLGPVDVVAIGPSDIRLIQVKAGSARCSTAERVQLQRIVRPANASVEVWRFPDHCRAPIVERV